MARVHADGPRIRPRDEKEVTMAPCRDGGHEFSDHLVDGDDRSRQMTAFLR